jgi:hypothetical protein
MKLGTLPRGLAVAAIAAVTVVPLAASAAGAAPAGPTAYTLFGSAQPLSWGSSSSVPVGELHVPFVQGRTSNLAFANSEAKLASPDEKNDTLRGESIEGLTCTGYADKLCRDPFKSVAQATHNGADARHLEQVASFGGKEGKFPGRISALTDCAGDCGRQLIRSVAGASGPAGAFPGYVSIGSSLASHDLSIDDRGRLFSTARSELANVSIGPKNEVHFSSLVTTAQAFGSGAANTKDGRADLRITDFFILDNPVELTRAGLRLANAGPSDQEAYDGAKVLLKKLRERGIILELPDFDDQMGKSPEHATVDTRGLRVRFEQTVGSVGSATISYPLELGRATAVVAAVDTDREIHVDESANGVVVNTTAPPAATPAPTNPRGPGGPGGPTPTATPGTDPKVNPPSAGRNKDKGTTTSGPAATQPVTGELPVPPAPAEPGATPSVDSNVPVPTNPDENALPSLTDIQHNLGLRGAHSVSRAFGAFLGLGLILPLARFVIRRLG